LLIAATAFIKAVVLATGNAKYYPMEDILKVVVKSDKQRTS